MKRIICITIALCLVLGSFSFSFAAVSDSQAATIVSDLSTIKSTLNTISSKLTTISNYLFSDSHSVAYHAATIAQWMQPIYGRLVDLIQQGVTQDVAGLLGSTETVDGTTVRTPYLAYNGIGVAQYVADLDTDFSSLKEALTRIPGSSWVAANRYTNANYNLVSADGTYNFSTINSDGNLTTLSYSWTNGSPLGNIALFLQRINQANANMFVYNKNAGLTGYNNAQSYTLWNDESLITSSFTPTSAVNGVYNWLSKIQEPVARLSYVLASDQDIEAREAAAENQQAVVEDFIDSSGNGSVGVSDFGSLSDASGEMKSNFNTGQSAAGVFNVFDDSHFLYLSQSAADQLDTTGSNNSNRLLKSSGNDYDTPVLDRYYEELNQILEVNKDD